MVTGKDVYDKIFAANGEFQLAFSELLSMLSVKYCGNANLKNGDFAFAYLLNNSNVTENKPKKNSGQIWIQCLSYPVNKNKFFDNAGNFLPCIHIQDIDITASYIFLTKLPSLPTPLNRCELGLALKDLAGRVVFMDNSSPRPKG